mmetsp:Transcript_130264/g.309101  ORF Transcript_130264/g.309101 Transcript_130264/m.309101 type:complete len:224 (-) Transcript_130264:129-800(-)
MSMLLIPFCLCTYSPFSMAAYLSRRESLGSHTWLKAISPLSRSLPMVLSPMSLAVTPSTSCPFRRICMRKPWGPKALPLTMRFATTTAKSAESPWEIQFLWAPSSGQCSRNICFVSSQVQVVFTTSPLFTPASFSVRQKQPSVPWACISWRDATCLVLPKAMMVPAKRLNWTVKRMPKPGPTFVAYSDRTRWAPKNFSGASVRSVSFRGPSRRSFRSISALCE